MRYMEYVVPNGVLSAYWASHAYAYRQQDRNPTLADFDHAEDCGINCPDLACNAPRIFACS